MKTEQEIVLQKKMIIIFSLIILAFVMGILNIQKQKLCVASIEDEKSITQIYTVYTASEELFTIEESKEELSEEEINQIVALDENEEEVKDIEPKDVETNTDKVAMVDEKVSSRGSYVRETGIPPTEYEKVIKVKATAYCLCQKCCGKSPDNPRYGYTASGIRIVPGTGMKVIAVDTSVVPLGTNVYVEGLNGASDYGYAIAADTGGAIKENKIDLYMDTHEQALAWGVKYVNLYILSK